MQQKHNSFMLFLSEKEEIRLLINNVYRYKDRVNMASLGLFGLVIKDERRDALQSLHMKKCRLSLTLS